MAKFHNKNEALATVSAIPVPISEASEFGIIEVDENWKIIGFQEKPEDPKPIPGNPEYCLASMGNYIFNADILIKGLVQAEQNKENDFGKIWNAAASILICIAALFFARPAVRSVQLIKPV